MTPRLFRLALRLCGDAAIAEELVNDALYRGGCALGRLRNPVAVRAWFARIVVNVWRDRLRKSEREWPLEDFAEPVAPAEFDPPARVRADELREQIDRAMRRLPPLQRAVMVLTVDEGLSIAEIAAALETTPSRVKGNLWYARQSLRRELRAFLDNREDDER